jgi:hypothetical protein
MYKLIKTGLCHPSKVGKDLFISLMLTTKPK